MAYLDETGLKELWSKMKDKMYPVGSVYLSTNNTSPADIYGGTWEQLKGAFLYAGESYGSGNGTGTSTNSHALTVNEMPSHSHKLPQGWYGQADWVSITRNSKMPSDSSVYKDIPARMSTEFTDKPVGGDAGHSHNIPYISVYAWRRTA